MCSPWRSTTFSHLSVTLKSGIEFSFVTLFTVNYTIIHFICQSTSKQSSEDVMGTKELSTQILAGRSLLYAEHLCP